MGKDPKVPKGDGTKKPRSPTENKTPAIVKVVTSGVPSIYPDVNVYDTTLEHMADSDHHEELSRLDDVYKIIEDPHQVNESKTNSRCVILTRNDTTSQGSQSPLIVPVKKVSDTEAIMQTAYYASETKLGQLLWKKEDE
jgi:hypothetical protein